jgi:hypothetical protein
VLHETLTIRPRQEDVDADSKATRCPDASSVSLSPCGACDGCPPSAGDLRSKCSTHKVQRWEGIAWYNTFTAGIDSTGSTIATRGEVIARLHQIFGIRDQAIRTRNPFLLERIYAVDCPCLKGDRQLIRELRQERLLWRGVKVSIDVQEVERVNDHLWTASAVVTTSSFDIVTESGMVVRRIPEGRELSRFTLARPLGRDDWLLGHASVIEERD